jgi:hypothetical protein
VAAGVPAARSVDGDAGGDRVGDPPIQHGYDAIAFGNCQGTTRAKVVLHVDDEERVAGSEVRHHSDSDEATGYRLWLPKRRTGLLFGSR